MLRPDGDCPCGTGEALNRCCGPYLQRTARPATAEALMRSRYTAFALGDEDHLFRTWDPRTRPDDVSTDPSVTWTGLEVLATIGGGPDDEVGEVRFVAHLETGAGSGRLAEHSRFRRHGGRWVYVDGDHLD